jgi:glycosidase
MLTENPSVQNFLIRAYQYVIGRYDIDGFRIDTLPYLKAGLPLLFGNAIREYALSVGKKNFFTFGEVLFGDIEDTIAAFIGRNTLTATGDQVGIDAALDYPLYFALGPVVQGGSAPTSVIGMYQNRKAVEEDIISSHGDATRFFVTFLDNHDMKKRLRRWDPAQQAALDDEVTLGIACLSSLPGIPCIYYGTEQGLHGAGNTDESVREALWGGPGFNADAPFYVDIAKILALRATEPAIRYGRFYFRQLSGDGVNFGFSTFAPGVLAFSRILNDREVLVVANASKVDAQQLHVVVDSTLTPNGKALAILYSNKSASQAPAAAAWIAGASVTQIDGSVGQGTCATLVQLRPGEVQIIG